MARQSQFVFLYVILLIIISFGDTSAGRVGTFEEYHQKAHRHESSRSLIEVNISPPDLLELIALRPGSIGPVVTKLKQYLAHYGYLRFALPSEFPRSLANLTDLYDDDLRAALQRFQQFWGLKITADGSIDRATFARLIGERCDFPDIINNNFWQGGDPNMEPAQYNLTASTAPGGEGAGVGGRRRLLFSTFDGAPKWLKDQLSFAIDVSVEFTSDVTKDAVLEAVRGAFNAWAAASKFTFKEVGDPNISDLKIRFRSSQDHSQVAPDQSGDAFTSSTTLAHAYSPSNGELHVYDIFKWEADAASSRDGGYDLQTVLLHEIGHLLGLGHSNVEGAVMYPSVSANTNRRVLSADDTLGIQSLYNAGPGGTPPGTPVANADPQDGADSAVECRTCITSPDGYYLPAGGSLDCRRFCLCTGDLNCLLTCPNGTRLGVDQNCYPAHIFPAGCLASSGPATALLVDPQSTVIVGYRTPLRQGCNSTSLQGTAYGAAAPARAPPPAALLAALCALCAGFLVILGLY